MLTVFQNLIHCIKQTKSGGKTQINMAKLISASICLTDIDKSKIKKSEKNGKNYLDITISVNDEKNAYDQDVSIFHGQTKEERTAKDPKKYIGNGKVFWTNDKATPASDANYNPGPVSAEVQDDLPW